MKPKRRSKRLQRWIAALVLLASGLFSADSSASPQSNCDPYLRQITNSQLGYRERGGRCEGLYIENVGGTTLLIASLTESFEKYDLRTGKALQVEWDPPPGANGSIRLRALGLKSRLYYRMDTVQPLESSSYSWPSDVLASLNVEKKDIGVVGSTRYTVGQTERDVHLPLRLSQAERAVRNRSYTLTLLPGTELQEVFVSLAPIGTDGRPGRFIKNREKLGYGYYPAERPIEIPISGLATPGTYYLQLGATLRNGGSSTIELWFYNPNR